jgi:hypothetical protein
MSLRYTYAIPERVIRLVTTLRARERDEVLRVFDLLADDPFIKGDRTQQDECGRRMEVKRFGRWEVTYWPDHGSCEVRIFDVTRLRR